MAEGALVEMITRYQSPQLRELARLIRDTPVLSAGDQAKYEKVERALAKALASRKDLPEGDIACRVAAATAIGILKLGVEAWLTGQDAGPGPFCKAAFAALKNVIARSEEHTSELQSIMRSSYAVFCWKKKSTQEQ